ncbi:MAG TPA: D-alanine--D-alanine ligase [Candidatus Deferrimicrobium sp.]|nr:D-alanine--D-alanine ligase [Candidatus Deferrimicrobium sp.]
MKVLLLAGGASNEREVSLGSGKAVFEALRRLGHNAYAIDPADGQTLLDSAGNYLTSNQLNQSGSRSALKASTSALAVALDSALFRDVDVVFIALHGGAGENGVIQCLLELAGIPYTGSNMTASAIAMDKATAKRLFASAGIATPPWELFRFKSNSVDSSPIAAVVRRFSFPVIVKPNDGGSTIGLTKVDGESELKAAFEAALRESGSLSVLVEEYIPGRELTVAVLDGEPLPVVEIKPRGGLYDYESKYTTGKSEYVVPAEIDGETSSQLQQAALGACHVIGASGLTRVDFLLDNSGAFYCLEVNTIPGMTGLSLAPMAARAAGIDFDELIDRLLRSAVARSQRRGSG